MSDEEEIIEEAGAEEEEVVEEEEEAAPPPPPPKREPLPMADDEAGVNEAQAALRAARAKQTEQNDEQIQEYIEMRAELQRKLEEEIEELKEQVAERKIERAREQEEMFERMRIEDERRKAEEEERRQKQAEDKAKRDLMKKKGGMNFNVPKKPGPKNYSIVKKDPEEAAAPAVTGPAAGIGPSKEELAAKKAEHIATMMRQFNFDGLGADDLKSRIKELHAQICKMEAARYDLEKRLESQDYDMRELEERQKQQARQQALKKGLDAEEAANSNHPPKVQVQSKYDRQIDRRNYGERHVLFDKPAPEKKWKVYHGTPAPPPDWGRKDSEELENLRKSMEPRKYQEQVKVEGAKAPVPFVPPAIPEKDALEADPDAEPPKEEPKEEKKEDKKADKVKAK